MDSIDKISMSSATNFVATKTTTTTQNMEQHPLYDKWVLWAHLPHDTDWSIKSYKHIMQVETVEQVLSLYSIIPEKLVKNCMLFLMRKGIGPTWEDPQNREGGCFSFKVANKDVHSIWRNLSFMLLGETLSNDHRMLKNITGITISPKRSFCIIKIWLRNCMVQNPEVLDRVPGLSFQGCIFKRHKPTY